MCIVLSDFLETLLDKDIVLQYSLRAFTYMLMFNYSFYHCFNENTYKHAYTEKEICTTKWHIYS